jgi:hypothetical protein
MDSGTVGQRVLEKVVARLGKERAARMLGISRGVLERLVAGKNSVPDAVLLKAVDLLAEGHLNR